MKKILMFILIMILSVSVFSFSALAYVKDDGGGNAVENGENPETHLNVSGDYMALLTQSVSVDGEVGGDVLGVFADLKTDGLTVGGSIRVLAVTADFKNTQCRNINIGAESVNIGEGVTAKSVVIFASGVVEFSGSCDSLTVYAAAAVIKGEIKNQAEIHATNVYFSPNSVINDVNVVSTEKPLLTGSSTSALAHDAFKNELIWTPVNVWKDALASLPSAIFYGVLGALLIQLVFGKSTRASSEIFKAHPVRYCFSGVSLLIAIPGLAIIVAMFSAELSMALALVFAAFIIAAQLFTGSVLGARLFPTMNRFLSAIMITTTLAVLCALPYVGYIFVIASVVIAFGYFSLAVLPARRMRMTPPPEDNTQNSEQ